MENYNRTLEDQIKKEQRIGLLLLISASLLGSFMIGFGLGYLIFTK